jgi:hypothetical protein
MRNYTKVKNLYLSGGMPRSASTWLFNVIRLILLSSPSIKNNFSSGWIHDNIPPKLHTLLKTHSFNELLINRAKLVAYSFRDVRDAVSSAKRKFGREPTVEWCTKWIALHEYWIKKAHIIMRYEDMLVDKRPFVEQISNHLGIKINPNDIIDQTLQLPKDSKNVKGVHNKVTLYHPNHITDGKHGTWKYTLDPSLIKDIETKHKEWFEQNNYSV